MDIARPAFLPPLVEIAFGCDAGYLQPLTIAISSVLTSARKPAQLRFWLVTKSLDAAALAPLRTLIEKFGAILETRSPMADAAVERMPLGEHFTEATYYRLMMPQLLPEEVAKVIYLDSDVIVRHPIEDLWAVDLEGLSTAAVFNPRALNYRQMGLKREADYFNAGVLVMDLNQWRKQRIHQRALEFAIEAADELLCADQDAINHILAGAWKRLDLRWNQQFKFFKHSASFLRVPWLELRRARSGPYIVHYSTNTKPWHSDNEHPWRDLYFDQLDRTHYRGWRPALPPASAERPRRRGGVLQRIASSVRGR
ncbi:MAG: glycosyltransferase family 8 protein [Opitutus sp.]